MVDAFPLPRHREKLCCSRSQCSHENPRLTRRAGRSNSVTKKSVEIMRAILADIQRGAEQLQMSMTMNSYDGSRRLTFSHTRNVLTRTDCETDTDVDGNNWSENAWMKLPKMGKKTFDGWPVREVSEGHGSRRPTSTSIDEAYPNSNKRHPRNLDKDKKARRENGLATVAQRMSSPQSEKAYPVQF
jgi:hypothetical protein